LLLFRVDKCQHKFYVGLAVRCFIYLRHYFVSISDYPELNLKNLAIEFTK